MWPGIRQAASTRHKGRVFSGAPAGRACCCGSGYGVDHLELLFSQQVFFAAAITNDNLQTAERGKIDRAGQNVHDHVVCGIQGLMYREGTSSRLELAALAEKQPQVGMECGHVYPHRIAHIGSPGADGGGQRQVLCRAAGQAGEAGAVSCSKADRARDEPGADTGANAKLTVSAEAPGEQAAVGFNSQGMAIPRRDLCPLLIDADSRRGVMGSGIAVAELALLVVSPGPQAAIGFSRQKKTVTRGYLRPIVFAANA